MLKQPFFSNLGPWTSRVSFSGKFERIQVLRQHPRFTKSEIRELKLSMCLNREILMHIKLIKPVFDFDRVARAIKRSSFYSIISPIWNVTTHSFIHLMEQPDTLPYLNLWEKPFYRPENKCSQNCPESHNAGLSQNLTLVSGCIL